MEKRVGEIICQELPYVHVLSSKKRGEHCDYCFDRVGKLKTCSSCHVLKYCCRKCQQSDWKLHKLECKCLKNVPPAIMTESICMFLRLLIRHKNGDYEKIFNDDPLWGRSFQDLMSHSSDIKKHEERNNQFHHIMDVLSKLIGPSFEFPSTEILWEIFGKMLINSHSIQDQEHKEALGIGIYLGTSKLDHSCDPNAVFTFSGPEITIRAVRQVAKAEPRQVFISYIDTNRPSWVRKQELKERFYFDCQCSLCTTKCQQIDCLMTSIKCPNSECNGFIGLKRDGKDNSVWPCEKCKHAPQTTEMIEQLHRIWDASCSHKIRLDELFKQGDMKFTLDFAEEKLEGLLENNFYKFNSNLIKIMEFAKDACIQLELWEKAANYAEKVSEGILHTFPSVNITVGLSFLMLGKLQLYLDRTQKASKSLKVAENILRVTHGPDHTLYQLLVDLQQQCCLLLANSSSFNRSKANINHDIDFTN